MKRGAPMIPRTAATGMPAGSLLFRVLPAPGGHDPSAKRRDFVSNCYANASLFEMLTAAHRLRDCSGEVPDGRTVDCPRYRRGCLRARGVRMAGDHDCGAG